MSQSRLLPNNRIDVADALRGIAVAGIILYHSVEHFDIFTQEPIVHTLPCDEAVGNVLAWLLSGKMYGIFAMLFGLTFFIMKERNSESHRACSNGRVATLEGKASDNQQQHSFSWRFAWRMCLLFVFGIINVAFYDGDILMIYAVYGLLLIPVSYLPSRAVWCIIVLLAIQPVELFCLLTGTTIDHTRLFDIYNHTIALHEHGTFWENAVNNVCYGFELNLRYNVFSGRLTQLFCFFVLGMQLGRQRLFYSESVRIWHRVLAISFAIIIALSCLDLGAWHLWLKPIYNLFILLLIVSSVISAWYAFKGVRRALHHLCTFGRMSLTNYLLQSAIGSFIFSGYGLACYRLVGTTYAVLIGLVMTVCQYLFCRWWLSRHSRGPLETIWRKLTWI